MIRVGMFGGYLMTSRALLRLPAASSFSTDGCAESIQSVIGARAFGIPPAEASRDDRLDGAHAHLPADYFSSTVQLGARGEIVERTGSRP